jgi:hypothetical protein
MRFEDTMHEVLQARRYNQLMGRGRNIWATVADFIEEHIQALFERLSFIFPQNSGEANVVPFIFAVIGGILLAVGLIVVIRMLIRARRAKVHSLSGLFEELAEANYTVADLLTKSREAETRRLSVRYRYIAVLLALDEKRIIKINPSATNALILRALKKEHPALTQPFTHIADAFHLAWFGNKEIDDTGYSALNAAGDVLIGAKSG